MKTHKWNKIPDAINVISSVYLSQNKNNRSTGTQWFTSRIWLFAFTLLSLLSACSNETKYDNVDYSDRSIVLRHSKKLMEGSTFLAVYDQISSSSTEQHQLCATISIRNTNNKDSVYIQKATLYSEKGKAIQDFFEETIFIRPMETLNLVIDQNLLNKKKGSNLLFEWACDANSNEPFFEGVMISSSGHQGFSFVTRGKRLK